MQGTWWDRNIDTANRFAHHVLKVEDVNIDIDGRRTVQDDAVWNMDMPEDTMVEFTSDADHTYRRVFAWVFIKDQVRLIGINRIG